PTSRTAFLDVAGKSDPLIRDALQTVLDRDGFVPAAPDGPGLPIPGAAPATIETDPDVVTELIEQNEDSVAALKLAIREKSGSELLDFILADFQELRRLLFDPRSSQVIMAGMQTTWWLNDHLQEWLGEKNAADVLTQSVPHNVTSEMGLALLDVADAIRPFPEKVAVLQNAEDESFVDELPELQAYLDKYGMRCVGEIDITRPRWSEQPSTLVPVLLTNIRNFEQGAGRQRFEEGLRLAAAKEQDVLERLRALPDGEEKAAETQRMIERVRTFTGYREYPKYGMVARYFVYKQALLEEAGRLVRAGVLDEREDIYFLRFQEIQEVVRTQQADLELIARRRDAFRSYQSLTPPRVLTSDGEAISGSYRRDDLPPGAIVGLPVSAGTVEGRARVVLDVADADLEPGDVLVTAYTDPSWSPLFVAIAGLVTEVGGVMTHGAVIAREYGLPAVVGVEGATRLIQDGQRIRVHGTDGYIEILPDETD
ncbi:MAG TPA: PEP-utilizing enzyme, partial [Lentzea sp.]